MATFPPIPLSPTSDDVYEAEDLWMDARREYGDDSPEAAAARENYDAVLEAKRVADEEWDARIEELELEEGDDA